MAATIINGTNKADTITVKTTDVGPFDIRAKAGNDTIRLLRTDDFGGGHLVDAGSGNDRVANLKEGNNSISLGTGNDLYVGTGFGFAADADSVAGGAGRDKFVVSTFGSSYAGGSGNDSFISVGWQNVINGGPGVDTISYAFRHEDETQGNTGVTVDLANHGVATGTSRVETVTSIENAVGSENGDVIFGTTGSNQLSGLGGADGIDGSGGNDRLSGGPGHDELVGGRGRDTFVFDRLDATSADQIDDFSRTRGDKVDLVSGTTFGGLTKGAFALSGSFVKGSDPTPVTTRPTLLYDTDSGLLFIDTDGTGAAEAVVLGQFIGIPSLQAADFHVF